MQFFFCSIFLEQSKMMELVNDKKNDNTYVTTSMNWLTIITESFAHFVLGVDDTLSDCFDIYSEKTKTDLWRIR